MGILGKRIGKKRKAEIKERNWIKRRKKKIELWETKKVDDIKALTAGWSRCTVPYTMYGTGFLCTVRYGIELVCTVFWCVRYFSGSEKKKLKTIII